MSLPRHLCGLAIAALVMAGGLISASSAKAEDLVDFLWGGSPEYGGGRSVVSFDPKYKPGQIIVSFSDRRLYWIMKPGVALTYPVAIPTGEARWQGVTSVTSKRVNPPWTPTPDMVRQNPRLPRWVPGGHPMNPLGIRAMYLGSSAYRIHGTDAPWTIGQAVSHGCIRMTNEDVLDLYPRIPVGTRVTVTWQQFKTQTISDGGDIPRYTDKDSNPRAAAAPSKNSQSASAESAPSASSSPASYTYTAYGSGKSETARKTTQQSSGGGLESLFFWADQPKQQQTAPSEDPEQKQASRDATKDDVVAEQKKPEEQKKVAEESDRKAVTKAPKKIHEASAEAEQPVSHEPADSKKKASNAAPAVKKKAAAAAAAKIPAPSDPSSDPTMAVPDPVKPTSVSAKSKESDATIPATKASASASEAAHVQKAAVQVQ
ncbi:MAG: L,D-transpeptidase family protein [Proteobacteria bacterium]|nr:L,D-transpeptidase family protein [Pseudomonadota bacterium]